MIRLILVRHGNTFEAGQTPTQVGARTDLPLTGQGRVQAQAMAQYLKGERLAAVYSGPLKRQRETAQALGKPIQLSAALNEIDYGPWEGLATEEIAQRWPREYTDWTTRATWANGIFGGAEETCLRGLEQWLAALRTTHVPGDLVIGVTSNGLIRLFYSFLKEDWARLVQKRLMETLKVKTGHFCELLLLPDSLEVKCWNAKPMQAS